jgi:hypothetical protein
VNRGGSEGDVTEVGWWVVGCIRVGDPVIHTLRGSATTLKEVVKGCRNPGGGCCGEARSRGRRAKGYVKGGGILSVRQE